MARKNPEPIITHSEILCRALRSLEDEAKGWEYLAAANPDMAGSISSMTGPIWRKHTALKQLYQIETGSEWDR